MPLRVLLPSYALRQLRAHLAQFRALPDLGTFEEALPRVHLPRRSVEHGVLLLHGFSSSTQTFDALTPELERRGLGYYAPQLTGFGLDDLGHLAQARASDWLRDALGAYDVLAASAERVSIVGVSTGATLGVYVSERRPVDRLVMVAPNLRLTPRDLRYRRLFEAPVLGPALLALRPYVVKPVRPGRLTNRDVIDEHAAHHHLDYPVIPTRSLRAVLGVQAAIDLPKARFARMIVLAGAHDQTVDIAFALGALDQAGLRYEKRIFERSAHNVLIDQERAEAARFVAEALSA